MASGRELFLDDALFEVVLGIEQQVERDVGRLGDLDPQHVANLGGIGSGAIAKGVYVVSLEKPGPVPPAPKAANVKGINAASGMFRPKMVRGKRKP